MFSKRIEQLSLLLQLPTSLPLTRVLAKKVPVKVVVENALRRKESFPKMVVLKLDRASETPKVLLRPRFLLLPTRFLTWEIWVGTQEFAFLTSSWLMLTPLLQESQLQAPGGY